MDLLIFIIVIGAFTAVALWSSKKLFQKRAGLIFIPALLLITLTVINGTLALVSSSENALLYAVGAFVFGPSGLITLVYALNHHFIHQKKSSDSF